MARSGFVAKGTVYVLFGVRGVRAALSGSEAGSTHAALVEVLRAPLGRWLLGGLAAGLVSYALWRFIEALGDANRKGRDPKGLAARAIYLASGSVYAALALDALALARWRRMPAPAFALRLIERLPQGEFFMGLMAMALMAYGAHQFLHARYRRINVP